MIRCPQCGVRLRDAHAACPVHGRAAQEPQADAALEHASTASDHVSAIEARTPDALYALGYRVTRVLGRGGFGIVYGAERMRDCLAVALKIVVPDQPLAAQQLALETRMLEAVGVPWVPAVYDRGVVLDRRYLTLEYIEAPTLADRLVAASGAVSLHDFERIARAILRPVAQIHARGIAHRDLKPENIFLCGAPDQLTAKIIDFGLANDERSRARSPEKGLRPSQDESVDNTVKVSDDDAIGTPEYMSPEQCDGRSDADQRSDIYSLGVVFYELLTGAPPFWGKSADVRESHRSRRPAPLPLRAELPAALDQLVRRCLAKDRTRRYGSVAELESALSVALRSEQLPERPSVVSLDEPRAAPAAAPAARERRNVSLVFFESVSGLAQVQAVVLSSGGQIVHTNGVQYVAAFEHNVGDNPVRSAFAAAQRLSMAKLAQRALVDVASVAVQRRPDGSQRLFSPAFAKKENFPNLTSPAGVMLTGAAIDVIPDLRVAAIPGVLDRYLVVVSQGTQDATTYGTQQATLVGRDVPLGALREHARRSLVGSAPSMVTVLADAGYGKTHFARTLEQQLQRLIPTPDVIRLTAEESIVGVASQLLPDLLRRLLTLPDHAAPDEARALLVERLGPVGEQVWAGAAFALGWLDAEHPDVRRLAAAPGALRLAAARATGEALRKRAGLTPVAVVLDDAHLADDVLLDALEYATLAEARARLWVCALARPRFEQGRPAWGKRAASETKVVLEALAAEPAAELTRRLLHPVEHVAPAVLQRLVERTQGIPRLLVELIRGLKRDGLIRRTERGGSAYYIDTDELDKLPDLPIVQWNASREVDALPAQLAGHARLSSVLGNGFTVAVLEALLQVLEREEPLEDMQLDASVGVQRLVDAGLLIRHRSGLLDFRHSLLRDTIYRLVPEAQQKRMHRAAFEVYQTLPMAAEQRLPRLALHAAHSGAREVAASAYLELAERSQQAHAYLDAEAAFGRALDNLSSADVARTCDAAAGRGLMRFRLGRHEDAVRDLQRAMESAERLGDHARALELMLDQATVLDWMREFARSAQLVRQASEQSETVPISELLHVKLVVGQARSQHRARDTEACVRLGAEAVERSAKLGDAGYEARVVALLMIAPDCVNLGRLEEADAYFEAAIREASAHSDLHHLAAAHVNRSTLSVESRNVARIFSDLTRAMQLARETGEPLIEFCSLNNDAEVAYAMSDFARATQHAERSLVLAIQLWGEQSRELYACELLLARIALHRNAFAQARALLENVKARSLRVLAMELAAGEPSQEPLQPAEQAMYDMVELGSRDASAEEWQRFEERYSGLELQALEQMDLLEGHALAALRAGRRDESRTFFERALRVSEQKPNLLTERVARLFAEAFGSSVRDGAV